MGVSSDLESSTQTDRREVRSFVRREGRYTPAQRQAVETLWPAFGLEKSQLTDLDQVFHRKAPRYLEIGCGIGDALIALAANNPDNDYLGIEVYSPGLGTILQRIRQQQLTNVRVLSDDAMDCLRDALPDNSLDGVLVFFPDPWPKKRHHKRRLIQPESLSLMAKKLKRQGRLFIATDWQDYADHILSVADQHPELINAAGPGHYAPRPDWRPVTRYEKRALRLGHVVRDVVLIRN